MLLSAIDRVNKEKGLYVLYMHIIVQEIREFQRFRVKFVWCKFMLEKFEGGTSQNVYYILTIDESWIYS